MQTRFGRFAPIIIFLGSAVVAAAYSLIRRIFHRENREEPANSQSPKEEIFDDSVSQKMKDPVFRKNIQREAVKLARLSGDVYPSTRCSAPSIIRIPEGATMLAKDVLIDRIKGVIFGAFIAADTLKAKMAYNLS